jgi:hypothetical protein
LQCRLIVTLNLFQGLFGHIGRRILPRDGP